jgi:flagellar biosynthesis/type III secretory pathway protein FliH
MRYKNIEKTTGFSQGSCFSLAVERAVTMGKNISGDLEEDSACGPQEAQGILTDKKKAEEEAYRAGRNTGYHQGYSLGFESGYEKGYSEGSTLGYNNGFLAALGLGEDSPVPGKTPGIYVIQVLQKLIAQGQARLLFSGSAAQEAKMLLKLVEIDADVVKKEIKI